MKEAASDMTSEDVAAFVTASGFDKQIADGIISTAVLKLKFRCLFQRHLQKKEPCFPPAKVAEFCTSRSSLKDCIPVWKQLDIHFLKAL